MCPVFYIGRYFYNQSFQDLFKSNFPFTNSKSLGTYLVCWGVYCLRKKKERKAELEVWACLIMFFFFRWVLKETFCTHFMGIELEGRTLIRMQHEAYSYILHVPRENFREEKPETAHVIVSSQFQNILVGYLATICFSRVTYSQATINFLIIGSDESRESVGYLTGGLVNRPYLPYLALISNFGYSQIKMGIEIYNL